MGVRAETERATGEAILSAALGAFSRDLFDRVTLQSIADASGVTVQTVIRRFGSKEHLFAALAERETPRILASREAPDGSDLSAALEILIDHYETDGETILNFVRQEHLFEPIRKIVEQGRRIHCEWVERYCREILDRTSGVNRARLLNAAIAATDLGTWKLLRRDRGLEQSEVLAVMHELLHGLRRK